MTWFSDEDGYQVGGGGFELRSSARGAKGARWRERWTKRVGVGKEEEMGIGLCLGRRRSDWNILPETAVPVLVLGM